MQSGQNLAVKQRVKSARQAATGTIYACNFIKRTNRKKSGGRRVKISHDNRNRARRENSRSREKSFDWRKFFQIVFVRFHLPDFIINFDLPVSHLHKQRVNGDFAV